MKEGDVLKEDPEVLILGNEEKSRGMQGIWEVG